MSALPLTPVRIAADQDVVRQGERSSTLCLLLEGFACSYQMLDANRRQIFSFRMPGDLLNLEGFIAGTMDHSVTTISSATVAYIPLSDIETVVETNPGIERALWRDSLRDAAIYREWISRMGKRDAPTRIAHLFCEVLTRLEALGLSRDHSGRFPITQVEIADALGITPVHVNRSLSLLRSEGLIELKGGHVTAPNWDGLKARGEFNPSYLLPRLARG